MAIGMAEMVIGWAEMVLGCAEIAIVIVFRGSIIPCQERLFGKGFNFTVINNSYF